MLFCLFFCISDRVVYLLPVLPFPFRASTPLHLQRKRRSNSRASQEAFIDLGSGDDTDSTVMEEGQTPRATSVSSAVTAAESTCSTTVVTAQPQAVQAPAATAQTPALAGKNSALVSGR